MPSNETTQLKTRAVYDLGGGMVTNYSYTKVKENQCKLILNGDMTNDGSIVTRYGRSKVNVASYGAFTLSSLMALGQTTGADSILVGLSSTVAGGRLITSGGITLKTLASDEGLMSAVMNDYGFFCNGVDTPFITNGAALSTYQMGISAPVSDKIYHVHGVAGPTCTPGNHRWSYRYRSTITGARSVPYIDVGHGHYPLGPAECYGVGIDSFLIPPLVTSTDPQVDRIDIFVQTAGAAEDAPYYYLGTCPNTPGTNALGATDDELMVRETLDIDDNVAPTNLRDIENFKGRMVGITGDYTIQYSKKRVDANGVVNIPTSWPATNELNVGWGDGDPLVKVIRFNDYLFAFKRRSVWLLLGDIDSDYFEFKQLKTNFTNVGLLNKRCVVQAGDSVYFISDDLKMHRFRMTDFSTEELRLQDPPPSDRVANQFTTFASAYRQYVNMVNFTFSQYTQIWISFTDGTTGSIAADNFSTFVYDYTADSGNGAWHIHTGHEVASSVLARAADNNYYIYTGDYQGYLWKHDLSLGDGSALNFMGWFPAAGNILMCQPIGQFTPAMDGCIVRCVQASEPALENEVRRVIYMDADNILVVPAFTTAGTGTGGYFTIGGIDFEVQSRDDWLDDEAPVDYDKQGWYLDLDITSEDLVTGSNPAISDLEINLYKDRTSNIVSLNKNFTYSGATWGYAYWGTDIWPEGVAFGMQVGMNLFFKQISHKIVSKIAGQRLRVNGWTYHFQQLGKLRIK